MMGSDSIFDDPKMSSPADELSLEENTQTKTKPRVSYTRELLLSLKDLDACKIVPDDLDQGVLRELNSSNSQATQDRQRTAGASRADPTSSFSRGFHGRWDTRTSVQTDKDNDSTSDHAPDMGRGGWNQTRWVSRATTEQDGLLGSGSFPRTPIHEPIPKARSDDHHPPLPYRLSRKEREDAHNDETFGSPDCATEGQAEEERRRRESFELMRKEQHKVFEEKRQVDKGGGETGERRRIEKPPISQVPMPRSSVPPGFTSAPYRHGIVDTSIEARRMNDSIIEKLFGSVSTSKPLRCFPEEGSFFNRTASTDRPAGRPPLRSSPDEQASSVLTCADVENSIFAGISPAPAARRHPEHDVDDGASRHIMSLLQSGDVRSERSPDAGVQTIESLFGVDLMRELRAPARTGATFETPMDPQYRHHHPLRYPMQEPDDTLQAYLMDAGGRRLRQMHLRSSQTPPSNGSHPHSMFG